MLKGHLHSVESLGTVDGPGLRYILFTQGCLLRCLYCHNPDTWKINDYTRAVTVEEMVNEITPFKPYFDASGGGVTVSGGEPLLQIKFLTALFQSLKAHDIHTCIDTSAGTAKNTHTFEKQLDALLKFTDLILLDIKHIDNMKHNKLTGQPNTHILNFAKTLSLKNQPVWIRHVLVPGLTDDKKDLIRLGKFINSLDNVERFEILPYHQLGVHKWQSLGLTYALDQITAPTEAEVKQAYQYVNFKGYTPI
ncbi:pyruvate formate-lyase-activating protein [Staphylococcus ureilyticus]|uniref:pyruvate formate-lyase-activating protein n=1 Tax=Staphylococcus TaxID=1279 RepID=UPI0008A5405C|nr:MULTISPECIES: pyruvate formate-lyase-activating protein [Staphylococcus]MDK7751681.1 pyruvate formate-lyase-activating protein [Staphylococcus sp. UMB10092B]MDT3982981.1 pyruvate formate-lyase-activating protein [Staphylococcus ureilyticus]OFQ88336.1 pyruvate formate-lyase 1-activating enzyme [Staphylococcus sp. HMSC065A08]OHO40627.1 pyruvate formate-lyase 1-activating enzyme [Staphylococcus sp. HMSC034G07]OLF34300.1 pyruvate formate-lyase 1-activating enzyme [Staphylococcus sp. 47.1]